jgi:hypothetical protein
MAAMGSPPTPDCVLLRRPGEPGTAPAADEQPSAACCLRGTRAGSRAVVYRTTSDQGIVGVFDFLTDSYRHPERGWVAEGVLRRLDPPLPRAELVADPVLAPVFRHIQGRKSLPPEVGQRLVELLDPLPPFASTP